MTGKDADRILDLVGSRRFCFVIMPYQALGLFYKNLRRLIQEATGLRCIRADEVPGSGQPLLDKIHALIERAELIVVELSQPSPNVYYEVGYAKAIRKEVLVICQKGTDVPEDLKGLERIEYEDRDPQWQHFEDKLRAQLSNKVDSDMGLLRAMLVAPSPSPSYILCSPRWRTILGSKLHGAGKLNLERRTYGDYLGVVGILYALGTLLGKEVLPELISAQLVDKNDLLRNNWNLYLIGSPMSNIVAADAMEMIQRGARTPWRFELNEKANKTTLHGWAFGKTFTYSREHNPAEIPDVDYGLVLRGPHPAHPGRQILFLGGVRSMGTGAACVAATRPERIKDIRSRLANVDLNDHTHTIWALASGKPASDNHLDEKSVVIEDAGVIG
ncbi:MAG: hypothetical protein FJ288_07395 [Planctomycetes bacterium]|nr:hypothetical protein [Planctomycetota bacterium]